METTKARSILTELADVLGDQYAEAIYTVMPKPRVGAGAREEQVLNFMKSVSGIPMSPNAVQEALKLGYTPATIMKKLWLKGKLSKVGNGAVYVR